MSACEQHPVTLIFPCGMPKAIEYTQNYERESGALIGASSILSDPSKKHYDRWEYLPFITDNSFPSALEQLIKQHNITRVFCPHQVVWFYLNQHLDEIAPQAKLVNTSPLESTLLPLKSALTMANTVFGFHDLQFTGRCQEALTQTEKASLYKNFLSIPGECDLEKLNGFYQTMLRAPKGDIVEIGSLWGRSAYALSFLARRYSRGKVLCIDPWSPEFKEDKEEVNKSYREHHCIEEAFSFFLINMAPYRSDANYLHLSSDDALSKYRPGMTINNDHMGSVTYEGGIAVLHIDGNHTFPCVSNDLNRWSDYLVEGGWIIVDDYVWCFGDGPRLAADRFIEERGNAIQCAFVSGGALFIQLSYAEAEH